MTNIITSIVPSFPAPALHDLDSVMSALVGVSDGFQVDIVDGKFVPAVSWPFNEERGIEALFELKKYSESYELEIDCMVKQPEQYLNVFVETGFKRVVVHFGSTEKLDEIVDSLHKHGIKVGVAVTNDVPFSDILDSVAKVDYLQVMGIKEVGKQGQPFDERTYDTVAKLRQQIPEVEIAIDGGVNETTIPKLFVAGANRFAPGSAITKVTDPVVAYKHLQTLITD